MAWTKSKLEALRAKFSDDQGGEMFDPHFKEIAGYIFGDGGHRSAPYAGMPTFLDAPAKNLDELSARQDISADTFSIDASSGLGLLLLLITAAFGGMLLNFTPCVLPLIPIKIISLSHVAENRRQCFMLGLAMSLGVLIFWLAIRLK